MKLYTGRGDEGKTELRTREEVSKSSPRIEAYGSVDELNALIGIVKSSTVDEIDTHLGQVQNDLHVVQAELANPTSTDEDPQITFDHVSRLEGTIDQYSEELEPLQSFVLPGGSPIGAELHHARTVCRRAERRVISLDEAESLNPFLLKYLNRLSDLLFILARGQNARDGVTEERPTY